MVVVLHRQVKGATGIARAHGQKEALLEFVDGAVNPKISALVPVGQTEYFEKVMVHIGSVVSGSIVRSTVTIASTASEPRPFNTAILPGAITLWRCGYRLTWAVPQCLDRKSTTPSASSARSPLGNGSATPPADASIGCSATDKTRAKMGRAYPPLKKS